MANKDKPAPLEIAEDRTDEQLAADGDAPEDRTGETPDEATERIVAEHVEAASQETGIAGSYVVGITFHRPSRLEEPDAPRVAALIDFLDEVLSQRYGFKVGVSATRTDR